MDDPDKPRSLDDLEARLRQARSSGSEGRRRQVLAEPSGAMGVAWRLAVEMAAALAVGGFLGWWLDHWLGTGPWMLIGGFLLGSATGLYNAIRAANRVNREALEDNHRDGGSPDAS